ARLQLGEEADVFNGDDGLVGEGLEERDLSFAEELNLRSAELDAADGDPLSQQRNAEDRAETELPRVLDRVGKLAVFVLEVGDLYRTRLEHRSASDRPADQRERELSVALGDRTVMRDEGQPVAVDAEDRRVERLTQPGGALRYSVEHRLNVGGRLADHAQDIARGRLLLERDPQLAVPSLKLREQPHVLDGDDRLIGKGPKQLNLRLAERAGCGPTQRDGADRAALAEHRHAQDRTKAGGDGRILDLVFPVRQDVGDVDDRTVANGPSGTSRAARAHGERPAKGVDARCA